MEMVRQERPGIHNPSACLGKLRQAPHEIISVAVVSENNLTIEAPGHHMVKDAGRIQARSAWHLTPLSARGGGRIA